MLQHLFAGRADGSADRRLASYLKPQLLVLDDFGLKPLPPSGPVDLYDVVDGRYERGSIVVTSNRAPSEWPELFSDPLLASAALDRLIHRAAVVLISGRSYRLASQGASVEGKEEIPTAATTYVSRQERHRAPSASPTWCSLAVMTWYTFGHKLTTLTRADVE